MARVSRVDPFVRQFEVWADELGSPAARSKAIADQAKIEIDRARNINRSALGTDAHYDVYVDGRLGAPIPSVKPGGVVFAEWSFLAPVLRYVRDAIEKTSPVLTGRFRQSHLLIVDGVEIASDETLPEVFEQGVFINSQPYARKIERGLSNQAPDGVYQSVAVLAHRRFGRLANVSFGYRALTGASALNSWAEGTSLTKTGRRTMSEGDRAEWLRRQPAILVEPI